MSIRNLPLIFALKHLYIALDDSLKSSPTEFSRFARLMQGDREIAAASDADVDAFAGTNPGGTLPEGVELQMLTMACQGWPEDATFALAGVSAFGAKNVGRATACAKHALTLNRNCVLARQLVKLLAAKSDVRCPFGTDAAGAPDVVAILSAEK
jgi:hypothetical protein